VAVFLRFRAKRFLLRYGDAKPDIAFVESMVFFFLEGSRVWLCELLTENELQSWMLLFPFSASWDLTTPAWTTSR
jgi:hypothetical protein